jgi:hypothetical protein
MKNYLLIILISVLFCSCDEKYPKGHYPDNVTNFAEVNSEYDEYRPITHYEYGFDNNLMIFSSNRPGGKGGFDLYYVGIPKSIKIH